MAAHDTSSDCDGGAHRRSSTRSIKRRKFDDELVESSLVKSERVRLRGPSSESKSVTYDSDQVDNCTSNVQSTATSYTERRRPSKGRRGKRSKSVGQLAGVSRGGLGRWKAQDDLALILAVQQTCDLTAVHLAVKFSCRFTLNDIKERWHVLLYDPALSATAFLAMRQLHPDVVAAIQSKALFSKEEERVLSTVTSTSQPTLDTFSDLLSSNRLVFLPCRTARSLHTHWLLLKQYHLLPDQTVQPMPRGDHVLNFSDAEDLIEEVKQEPATEQQQESLNQGVDLRQEGTPSGELKQEQGVDTKLDTSDRGSKCGALPAPRDRELERELTVADRRQKREIRQLEAELPKWQVLVDSVTGISPPEFDNLTLAVIRGRLVRYLMRSRCITVGRSTKRYPSTVASGPCTDPKGHQVDVDLSLEGPAWKISRRQGYIKLIDTTGEFQIFNEGKRPIYVDGQPVLTGSGHALSNHSVIEMSCLRFIFLVNQDLVGAIKLEANKSTVETS